MFYSVVCHISSSTGDMISLLNNSRESIISARNKALGFILRNGGKGVYCIYETGENALIYIETKSICRLKDGTILRRMISHDEFEQT